MPGGRRMTLTYEPILDQEYLAWCKINQLNPEDTRVLESYIFRQVTK
jgi:hypothetical protein